MADVYQTVRDAISGAVPRLTGDNDIALEQELYGDLHIDSRRFLKIIRSIEDSLGIEIDDEDLLDHDLVFVKDLVGLINNLAEHPKRT
jgi:acyl carrier protein